MECSNRFLAQIFGAQIFVPIFAQIFVAQMFCADFWCTDFWADFLQIYLRRFGASKILGGHFGPEKKYLTPPLLLADILAELCSSPPPRIPPPFPSIYNKNRLSLLLPPPTQKK